MMTQDMLTAEQLEKIENAREVRVHYSGPHETKWAVVKYVCRQGKPFGT